jgi:hypothetical protein
VPGCEGHERKEEKKQQRLHRDPAEESPGLHETEKQEREGACEKPPSTANQPAHAPILSWIARVPKLRALGRSGIDHQEHSLEDQGDRRPSRRVALGLTSEAPTCDRAGSRGRRSGDQGGSLGGSLLGRKHRRTIAPPRGHQTSASSIDIDSTASVRSGLCSVHLSVRQFGQAGLS